MVRFSSAVRPDSVVHEIRDAIEGKSNQRPELPPGYDVNIVGRYDDPPCQDGAKLLMMQHPFQTHFKTMRR